MKPENINVLSKYGAVIIEELHTSLSTKERKEIAYTYYTLGQGFKVAVEVTLIATDNEVVNIGDEVIVIGGTTEGADTAIIVKASIISNMIGPDINKRLEIKEIIAMPRKRNGMNRY
ncbi:MAG: hypothetical protein DRO15_07025 [Thermoprotei archaeon]|nr:MAG: hypothetical protein DRO15_07025 [Thermoprotei archaeon]